MAAGIPIDHALSRMTQLQPTYAEFWARAVQGVQAGRMLSDSLKEVWPEALVSAVRAGEQSGKMVSVFAGIKETIELQRRLRDNIMKLAYPVGMAAAGLVVFVAFMVFVLPSLGKAIGRNGSSSPIFQFSSWLSEVVLENYVTLGTGIALAVVGIWTWLKTPEARTLILEVCLRVPVVQIALRDMYFGLWANYMSMMVAAGIPTTTALLLTSPVLPGPLRESVEVFERDLSAHNQTMSSSADLEKLPEDDSRRVWWPFYISNAFIVAEQTGEVDAELERVSPSLIEEGLDLFASVLAVLNVIAIAVAATLIVSPLAAYYIEIFAAIRMAGR